jgi:hypothetical protein
LLCPEGIILAADMRETTMNTITAEIIGFRDKVKKIYRVKKKTNVGISCWGLAEVRRTGVPNKDIVPYLAEFDHSSIERGDTVDAIAGKLKQCLENVTPPISSRMGFHVAGYIDLEGHRAPHLRHVFRWDWHRPGEFTNENSHTEYHLPYGDRVSYKTRKEYPTLFNGDNLIANALFNYAPSIRPYCGVVTHLLSLNDCIELAKLVISTSIQRLNYFFDLRQFRKIPPIVGGGVKIAKITEINGFEWV